MVQIIGEGAVDIDELLATDTLIDAKVVSKEGRDAGRVASCYFEERCLSGLRVVFDGTSYYISDSFIEELDGEAVMLNIQPFYVLQGLKVYDESGRYLGEVEDVTRAEDSNDVEELVVRKHWFSTPRSVAAEHVETANENIILNEAYDNE